MIDLERLIGVAFPVPKYDFTPLTISRYPSVGDKVRFTVDQKRKGYKRFVATGRIVEVYTSTFGGVQRKSAAKLEMQGRYLVVYPGRKHTTVAIDKLKPVS